jgi:hypothetical protein
VRAAIERGAWVIEVPQAFAHLLTELDGKTLVEASLHFGRYGQPRLMRYDERRDPGLGYGLLLLSGPGADATVHAGPTNWDCA